MRGLDVLVLYNEPTLARDDPDWASEAGVLESVDAVVAALTERGHAARKLGIATIEQGLEELPRIESCDVVFNLFEGLQGVGQGEATVAGLLEALGHSVTGSPAQCLELARDKARTKWLLAGGGVPTPPFVLVRRDQSLDRAAFDELLAGGAVIVKPAHEDASLGIDEESIVRDHASLLPQIERVRTRYGDVLVERFVVGREFNAAILEVGQPQLLPLAEIEFKGHGPPGWQIVSYQAKWDVGGEADLATPACCPARVDEATWERIGQAAVAAYRLTGCRDYARVDLRMDARGDVFVLEVNANPDIGPGAGFARALRAAGWEYADFVEALAHGAKARGSRAAGDQLSTRR